MVGVTGLEPATSRPPAVRATNCATPRHYFDYNSVTSLKTTKVSIAGRYYQRLTVAHLHLPAAPKQK